MNSTNKKKSKKKEGALFEIKSKKIKFDSEQCKKEEQYLLDKMTNYRLGKKEEHVPNPFKKSAPSKKLTPIIKPEFLTEAIKKNFYSHMLIQDEINEESKLFKKAGSTLPPKKFQLTSPKLIELENELQRELNKNIQKKNVAEDDELQGTKGLSKFDCWDEDLDPIELIGLNLANQEISKIQNNPITLNISENQNSNQTQNNSSIPLNYSETKDDIKNQDQSLPVQIQKPEDQIKIPNAKCPMYKNGKYIWVDALVLNYFPETKRFEVEIIEGLNGKRFVKNVDRLSLYFIKENFEKFKKRVRQCRFYQQKVEDEIRFIRYTENVDPDEIPVMPVSILNILFRKIFKKNKESELIFEQQIFSKMMKLIKADYLFQMKRCIVYEEMKDQRNLEMFKEKKIDIRRNLRQKVEYDIIQKAQSKKGFSDKVQMLKVKIMLRNKKVEEAMRIFQSKTYVYKKAQILDISLIDRVFPFELKEFIQAQREFFDKNKEQIRIQWREYPLGDVSDILRKVVKFQGSFNNILEYRKPGKNHLERLLHRFDFQFRKNLRDFIQNNLNLWCGFIRSFTLPDENSKKNWLLQDKCFLKLRLKFSETIPKRKKEKTGKEEKKREESLIFFEPKLEDISLSLKEPINWLLGFVSTLDCLETDIVRVLSLSAKKILIIDDKEEAVQNAYTKIDKYLIKGFDEPNKILEGFKRFEFLLEKSKEDIIKSYLENIKKKKSVDNIDGFLDKLTRSIAELNALYTNEHSSSFFQVSTKELKEELVLRAKEIKKGFLKKISFDVVKSIGEVREKYKQLETELTKEPTKEEELVILNKMLETHEDRLAEIEIEVNEIYQFILLMEKYGEQFEDSSMISFWLLKVSPLEVKVAFNKGKIKSASQEQAFLVNLADDKRIFEADLLNAKIEFEELKMFDDFGKIGELAKKSEELGIKFDTAKERVKDFNRREELFKMAWCSYEALDKVVDDFAPYRQMWETGFYFDSARDNWLMSPIIKLNFKKITSELDKHRKTMTNLLKKFEEEDNISSLKVCKQIKDQIKQFERNLPIIEHLTKECIVKKANNWKYLFTTLDIKANQQTETLQSLINLDILLKVDQIEEFVSRAEKEYSLEIKLNKEILEKLKGLKIEIIPHKQTGSYLIGSIEELQTTLDELLNIIIMMKQSPYIIPVKKKVEEQEKKLIGIQDLLVEWIKCQRQWLYLQPIFASEDLKKKMPLEKKMFDGVDKIWTTTMAIMVNEPCIFEGFDWEKAKADFEGGNKILDQVQKSLSEYLEAKREEFPRFYFLSDEELIEIISKTKDPACVTKYLNKCFEGIDNIEFNSKDEIITMISSDKEKIVLNKPINVSEGEKKGNVEKWLSELEDVMRETLKIRCKESLEGLKEDRISWLRKWPGQLLLAINSVRFTSNTETAIGSGNLIDFEKILKDELSRVVDLVRTNLSNLDRINLSSLIVIDVHAMYVVNDLITKGVKSITDFPWISQLRYYFTPKQMIKAKIMTADYDYQYEYLGNSNRLVITPLTDRCYRTLMSAFQNFYGGAPEGPAGTGKTETVKDLAKAVAVQCNVFNCTDQINYVAMSKFFKGLSQTGSWCCFDEFNRIELEVLSVIAEQVRTIQNAIKERKNKFFFEGKNMKLVKSCAVNITMNPGYAGRSELPDNLKALFRGCAMMVPDYSLISEISLYSNGFQKANILAAKIVGALRLSSEQLSSQKHYDFGMRTLKAILVAAGNIKRKEGNEDEDKLCLQALNEVNIPKFTANDIPLFESIISDLFPGVKTKIKDRSVLRNLMSIASVDIGIIPKQKFIDKAIQIYETTLVRHGLMIVGETCSGKTKSLSALKAGLEGEGQKVQKYIVNPKAVTGLQLYGTLDPNTKVWTDGVLPVVMKQCESADELVLNWVVFDGPVDAVWIENMNTLLDDNKILCLTNGQKIKLTNKTSMMFEVEDLVSASPATVSRCGMVFMELKELGWKIIIKRFIDFDLPKSLSEFKFQTKLTLKWLIGALLGFVRKNCKLPMKLNDLQLVANVIYFLNVLFKQHEKFYEGYTQLPKDFETRLIYLFIFGVVWGLGGVLDENDRQLANQFFIKLLSGIDVKKELNIEIDYKNWAPRLVKINSIESNLYNLVYDFEKNNWSAWLGNVELDFKNKKYKFEELIIPTSDSTRNAYFVRNMLNYNTHLILVGPTGTGKTIGALSEIKTGFSNKDIGNICTNFSGQTHVNAVQRQIESKMTTRKGKKGYFGPEDNKKQMVVFIDDVNMPIKEVYGAQPPIELLRMFLDYQFLYDLDSKEERYLIDMNIVATMGPPNSGRNSVSSRFLRHFFILYVQPFDSGSLTRIFSSILDWHFASTTPKFAPGIIKEKDSLVQAAIDLYGRIKLAKELLPTPNKSHYIFSLRDISRVFQTMTKSSFRTFKAEEDFAKLWAHESKRVFQDRLIDELDQSVFNNLLYETLRQNFGLDYKKLVKSEPLIFADFVPTVQIDKEGNLKPVVGVYTELFDKQNLKSVFDKFLIDFNESSQEKLNLVLFMEAIEHVIRILRVITTPNGHSLLVGLGGSGRKSYATLAGFVAGFDLKQIEMSSTYSYKDWIQDLQTILRNCGVENNKSIFLLRDSHIFNEEILEDVSCLLNRGEVPNLFSNEEKFKIIDEVSNNFTRETEEFTNSAKFDFFGKKCKENLHLVLLFSPVGENFRKRLRTFPSFINCTTIDWYLEWPKEALNSVAASLLKEENIKSSEQLQISNSCQEMHISVSLLTKKFYNELRRYYYVTPASYLELISTFRSLLRTRIGDLENNIKRYVKGVKTLETSKEKVEEMKKSIIELEPKLKTANDATEDLIKKVESEKIDAADSKKICEQEEILCNKNREEASELKQYCLQELNKVEPVLEAMSKNLKTIQRSDIDFIKQIKNPKPPVQKLFQALCVIFKPKNIPIIKDPSDPFKKKLDYSTSARTVIMAKPDQMLAYLLSLTADAINELPLSMIKELNDIIKDPLWNLNEIQGISVAAGKIAGFVNAVTEIYEKLQIINPKREALKDAMKKLESAEMTLKIKKDELKAVLDKIENLENELHTAKEKREELKTEIEQCKRRLSSAEKLVNGLEGEKNNWLKYIKELKRDEETILGDVLLSSGIIAFLGIFPINYREQTLEYWKKVLNENKIIFSSSFDIKTVLSNEIAIGNWTNKYKLPNDFFSIDNAIILSNSSRFPLMIDPQTQAHRWISQMEKENKLVILKPNSRPSEIQNILSNAIEIGLPVLVENIEEEIDWNLSVLLENKRKVIGKRTVIKYLDKWLDLSSNFRLYLTTKLSRPHYSPEVCVMVTMLNFQVTAVGLEDQLLNILVAKEDPNSDKARQNNIKEFYELKKKQKATEENILSLLTNNTGNILDDVTLIETLQKSKIDAKDAALRIADIESMKKKLTNTRNFYKKAANRASNLFFCVTDLGTIEPMYQFSLDWFIELYVTAINNEPKIKETRVRDIITVFTKTLFSRICCSLFEKDKMLFSFLIYLKTLQCEEITNQNQLRILFVGGSAVKPKNQNLLPEFINDKQWAILEEFSEELDSFKQFLKGIYRGGDELKKYMSDQNVENIQVPNFVKETLNEIDQLILLRVFRPEKVIPAIQKRIAETLGPDFVDYPTFNLETVFLESKPSSPIIFILSPGSDPLSEIFKLASVLGKFKNVDVLSLGQGQEATAQKFVEFAQSKGRWVVLQNCHLAPKFLFSLEKLFENQLSPEFRLILTSNPSNRFPISILQNGIKITNEPPRGIKANMLRTYNSFGAKYLEHPKSFEFKKLLFGLTFFHSVVQERKKYFSLGWNIPYEFSQMDFAISSLQLISMLKDFETVPWEALKYSIAEANYGGRVTDPMDRRLILVILNTFLGQHTLDQSHKFDDMGIYPSPEDGDLSNYKNFIKTSFPLNDPPAVFGLHQNSDIRTGMKETTDLMVSCLSLMPRTESVSGKSSDVLIKEKCQYFLKNMPPLMQIREIENIFPIQYENSLNTVLIQELMRYNRLTSKISSSLTQLVNAIEGFVIMTEELDEMYNKIFNNNVPDNWLNVSYPSTKQLFSWFSNYLERIQFMNKWVLNGQPPTFWISGFFFTQSFLTGILQNYARKLKLPIDTLVFEFSVVDKKPQEIIEKPEIGAFVYGLYLEAGKWNSKKNVLEDADDKVLFSEMPIIWMKPIKEVDKAIVCSYNCPVYKTSKRAGMLSTTGHSTNYVISVDLPIPGDRNEEFWIKRGVALLCELDD